MRTAKQLSLAGLLAAAALLTPRVSATTFNTLDGAAPEVIGHRGSTGYMPEHTLGGYELAVDLGADYIEPDLQLTSDGQLVCMHDATLDRTTNVASLYAKRNGHTVYDVSDFTLAEIEGLTAHADTSANPLASNTGYTHSKDPTFTPMFSTAATEFKVPSFTMVLDFVKEERAAGHDIGVYPEAKTGSTEMENDIIAGLTAAGLTKATDKVIIQSFDASILKDIHSKETATGSTLSVPLMQLDSAPSASKLATYATYAQIVGPDYTYSNYSIVNASYIATAHADGLEVHGYTFNDSNESTAVATYEKYYEEGMDGVFSNYVDLAAEARNDLIAAPEPSSAALLLAGSGMMLRRRRRAR